MLEHGKCQDGEIESIQRHLNEFCRVFEYCIPIMTVSEANGGYKRPYKRAGKTYYKSEHWSEKYRRHKKQKRAVGLVLGPDRSKFSVPCRITLTRFGVGKLDKYDNLPMAFKWILDACCELITGDYRPGRADDNEDIQVVYDQVLCDEYSIKIKIEC